MSLVPDYIDGDKFILDNLSGRFNKMLNQTVKTYKNRSKTLSERKHTVERKKKRKIANKSKRRNRR